MLRYVKSGMMLMSIAYIVLGLMLLIMPETSLLWICYAFGVVVLITGIVCLIQYARIRGTGFTAPFMLVGGVITAGLGLFTLAKPQVVASFLPVVFGIFIVVDGCSRIGSAIDLAKRKGEKWWMLLLFSIVSIALGALLIWHPFGAAACKAGSSPASRLSTTSAAMASISCQRYHWVKVSNISLPTQRYSSAAGSQLRSHSSVCTV